MTEEPETVDAENSGCVICGREVYDRDESYFLEVFETGNKTDSLDVGFCSWDHVAEWSAQGPPDFPEYSDEPWSESIGERLVDGFTFAMFLLWGVLAAVGAYTVVTRLI